MFGPKHHAESTSLPRNDIQTKATIAKYDCSHIDPLYCFTIFIFILTH